GALLPDVEVADKLLRDRRAALDDLAGADVAPERTRNADVIDAAVSVETAVLDGDGRPRQPRAQVREHDRLTVPVSRDRAEQRPPSVLEYEIAELVAHVKTPSPRKRSCTRSRRSLS